LLKEIGASKELIPVAMRFFYWVGGGVFTLALMTIFGAVLRANGDTRSPMYVSLIANLLNIAFDVVLIFGLGPIPALGVLGAGIGTFSARLISACLLYRKIQKGRLRLDWRKLLHFEFDLPLLKISLPAAGERLMMRGGDVLVFMIILLLGQDVFAGNSIGETIISFFFLPGFGLATAVSILVAYEKGKGNLLEGRKIARSSFLLGAVSMTFIGLVVWLLELPIIHCFTHHAVAVETVSIIIFVSFLMEPIVSGTLIYTAALQGLGNTKTPFIATTIGMLFFRILFGYFLTITLKMGILGIQLATGIDNLVRWIILYSIFRCQTRKEFSDLKV